MATTSTTRHRRNVRIGPPRECILVLVVPSVIRTARSKGGHMYAVPPDLISSRNVCNGVGRVRIPARVLVTRQALSHLEDRKHATHVDVAKRPLAASHGNT